MRTITEKDRRGLLVAFRRFLRAMSGERISAQAGGPLLDEALEAGLSFDALLNRENWGRALEVVPDLTARDYVKIMCENGIEVKELTEEPRWHELENGFGVIAEAAHDFFMEVSGRGGKWNIPSALTNLAKAVREHSLQAILSEDLIGRLTAGDDAMTYFGYIEAIARDFDSLDIDDTPTPAQLLREKQQEEAVLAATTEENPAPDGHENNEATESGPGTRAEDEYELETELDDSPFPEEEEIENTHGMVANFRLGAEPDMIKRSALRDVLENYTPAELAGIVDAVEGGRAETIGGLLDALARGRFDPALETADAAAIHRSVNADLMVSFIGCVRMQGIEMDEELAARYDILHDSWDLRTPQARKLHKLKDLVISSGTDDPDLLEAIRDIERLYASEG